MSQDCPPLLEAAWPLLSTVDKPVLIFLNCRLAHNSQSDGTLIWILQCSFGAQKGHTQEYNFALKVHTKFKIGLPISPFTILHNMAWNGPVAKCKQKWNLSVHSWDYRAQTWDTGAAPGDVIKHDTWYNNHSYCWGLQMGLQIKNMKSKKSANTTLVGIKTETLAKGAFLGPAEVWGPSHLLREPGWRCDVFRWGHSQTDAPEGCNSQHTYQGLSLSQALLRPSANLWKKLQSSPEGVATPCTLSVLVVMWLQPGCSKKHMS